LKALLLDFTEAESTVSRAHVIEDDSQPANTSVTDSVEPVQEEEEQHQEPDGKVESTFY
jgi:hypothetical protein